MRMRIEINRPAESMYPGHHPRGSLPDATLLTEPPGQTRDLRVWGIASAVGEPTGTEPVVEEPRAVYGPTSED